MTEKSKTKGFIFKEVDKLESDKVFSIFTEDYGRLDISAKAVRKINSKLRPGIKKYFFSEIEFVHGKNNKTLTDAKLIGKNFLSLGNLEFAYKISDILDRFIKGEEKDPGVFTLLSEVFSYLNQSKNKNLLYYYFLWNFLFTQGFYFEIKKCVNCKNGLFSNGIYISSREGGVVCGVCSKDKNGIQKINEDVIKFLRLVRSNKINIIKRLKIDLHSEKIIEEISNRALIEFSPSNL